MDRFEIDPADYTTITDADPEALAWIRGNGQEAPLAGNRFDREDALAFVEQLYAAGAARVVVAASCIRDDAAERALGGPYADGLKVELPDDPGKRRALFEISNREAEDEGFDPEPDEGQRVLVLWWD